MFNSLSNGINYRKNSMKPTTEMTIAELEIEMNRLQEEIRKANEENDVLNTQLKDGLVDSVLMKLKDLRK